MNRIQNRGVSFTGLLFVALLVLKLTGVIAWSWWWITTPVWAPFLIAILVVAAVRWYISRK